MISFNCIRHEVFESYLGLRESGMKYKMCFDFELAFSRLIHHVISCFICNYLYMCTTCMYRLQTIIQRRWRGEPSQTCLTQQCTLCSCPQLPEVQRMLLFLCFSVTCFILFTLLVNYSDI